MKAKEYAHMIIEGIRLCETKFSQTEFDKMMIAISLKLLEETKELKDKRRCQTASAISAVLDEMDDKWQAVCRIVNNEFGEKVLKPTGYRELIHTHTRITSLFWNPRRISSK